MRDRGLLLKLFCAATLCATPALASYESTVLADAPQAYWRFGELSGSTAYDSSGHGRNAAYAGPTLGQIGALAGDGNPCVVFTAVERDAVARADSTGLVPGLDSWSVEVWVKTAGLGKEMALVSWYPGGYVGGRNSRYSLSITSTGVPVFSLRDFTASTAVTLLGPAPVADGAWHHVVAVLDRERGRGWLYVDGAPVSAVSLGGLGVISDTGFPINIGRQTTYWSSAMQFEGELDEVALYRGALSPERVRAHFDVGRGLADDDGDGVANLTDQCPGTPAGGVVDRYGCQEKVCVPDQQLIDAVVQQAVAAQNLLLAQKDGTISELNLEVNGLLAELSEKDAALAASNAQVAALTAQLQSLTAQVTALTAREQELVAQISSMYSKAELDQAVQNLAAAKDAVIAQRDGSIVQLEQQIAAMFTKEQLDQSVSDGVAVARLADAAMLSADLDAIFGVAGFVLPGATATEQLSNLTGAIGELPSGQIKKLKELLTP